jgi:phage/plasmid-like protein (TIGR03299 family)
MITYEQENEMTDVQFSTREVPWMKLSKLADAPQTAAEAAKLGGLDFTVSLQPVYFEQTPVGQVGPRWHNIPGRKAVVRDDTGDFFGFVSSTKYNSLQYRDAFNFMDTINPTYVAAGALRSGRQGFMVVKPEIDANVLGGDDPHGVYAVLRTSHDCTRATEVSVMMLRGKCMNQLTLKSFTRGVDYRWSIKHTSTQAAKLAEAQDSLQKIGVYVKRFEQNAQRLVDRAVNPDKAKQLLEIVIPMPNGKTQRTEDQYKERINDILNLWMTSPQVDYAGTGWGLVNAVSEHFEWQRAGGTPESRFIGGIEGQTHKKINKMAVMLLSNA